MSFSSYGEAHIDGKLMIINDARKIRYGVIIPVQLLTNSTVANSIENLQ